MNDKDLNDRCNSIHQISSSANEWITNPENSPQLGPRLDNEIRMLKEIGIETDNLKEKIKKNMSIAVFGPSQAGKSFLVSVLARPNEGKLIANFQGKGNTLDYQNEINPSGGKESTGIVTRFTMNHSSTPENFPVKLSILKESDIICILCNSFHLDGDGSDELSDKDLVDHIEKFRDYSKSECSGLSIGDIWAIENYTNKRLSRFDYTKKLDVIWKELERIAPYISREHRGELFSILWGKHKPFTQLYLQLTNTLDLIKHSDHVFTKIDALVPRENSIIDVKMLSELFPSSQSADIEIRTCKNENVMINKSVLCALTAELEIPMKELSHNLFKHTDILDFPGARTRFERSLVNLNDSPDEMSNFFLRGKVAYLFDRYVKNYEVTAMLLCIPNSVMAVKGLPVLIDDWVSSRFGEGPEQRIGKENVLFFVLTKFDIHLTTQVGSTVGDQFKNRMEASFENFGNWTKNWTPDQPFNNCYWLRNPYIGCPPIFTQDSSTELELKNPESNEIVDSYFNEYIKIESIQNHFEDPTSAWNAAMTPNDGGVNYLIERMSKVCREEIKPQYIVEQLNELANQMHNRLEEYYIEDDIGKRLSQKNKIIDEIENKLISVVHQEKFGEFMGNLVLPQTKLRRAIENMPIKISSDAIDESIGSEKLAEKENVMQPTSIDDIRRLRSREFNVARIAVECWIMQLNNFCNTFSSNFGLDHHHSSLLSNELQSGLLRCGIDKKITSFLKDLNLGKPNLPSEVLVCSEYINRFVAFLGIDQIPVDERPKNKSSGNSNPIFVRNPVEDDILTLTDEPRNTDLDYCENWIEGIKYLVSENLRFESGIGVNVEQNELIGNILKSIGNLLDKGSNE